MAASGYISAMNGVAREQAHRQRLYEADIRRHRREQIRRERDATRLQKQMDRESKQAYLESRLQEAADLNADLGEQIEALQTLLSHTLFVNDTINFESLRIREKYTFALIPQELSTPKVPPDRQPFLGTVKAPGFLENALGMRARYQRELQAAESQFQAAWRAYDAAECERQAKLAELKAQDDAAYQVFLTKVKQRDDEVDELEQAYKEGQPTAVITYNSMVLERSVYPDEFPQRFRLAYAAESKELVIEYELPSVEVIPSAAEYKYVKSKDSIDEKARKPAETKELYQDVVASTALRTLHEVFEADQGEHLLIVSFNGFVSAVDPATGKDIRPCLVSVRVTHDQFCDINLARVEKRTCLRNLGAQVSPQPQEMQAVKPIVEFDMVDKRFVEAGNVLEDLESRPNLMDLNPTEFETLVTNLFQKMGLETKQTRASRDGGVDAVAFDLRPVLGGKVVIQAKRYKNTVGVSAVRDLYGTMLNEGANKGIIVATSSYGPDAYEFSKDKPIEMIDGGGLLYLLDQVGVKARIVIPE